MKSSHCDHLIESRPQPCRLQVAAALIVSEGRVFTAQRAPDKQSGYLWESLGGKVERGETQQEALQREIKEELCWRVEIGALSHCVRYSGQDEGLDLFAYWCSIADGELCLREHIDYCWAFPEILSHFSFTRPDEELVSMLQLLPLFPNKLERHDGAHASP